METHKVRCPHCGYEMPVWYRPDAECHGVQLKCKNRACRKEFGVTIKEGKQYSG